MILNFLLLGAFNPGALENIYRAQFERLGIYCECIDVVNPYYFSVKRSLWTKAFNKILPQAFYHTLNTQLQDSLKTRYEVIIVFKGMFLYPETILHLKRYANLLICYNPDHPFLFFSEGSGNANVERSIRHYDMYYTYSARIAEELQRRYQVAVGVLPFGYDDRLTPASHDRVHTEGKILFIGSYDKERADNLQRLQTNNWLVYGDPKWKYFDLQRKPSRAVYAGGGLFLQDYADAVAHACGVLNFLRPQNKISDSHNMRTFEVPGYGGVLISSRTEEQCQFFTEDIEALYFDSREELDDKIAFLESNPAWEKRLKRHARLRSVSSGYAYSARAERWLSEMKNCLK